MACGGAVVPAFVEQDQSVMPALRRRLTVWAAALAAASALFAAACIITDPPTDLPKPVAHRPTILRDHPIVPPNTSVLGVFPSVFLLDVEVDPNQIVEWRLFIDYNPLTGDGFVDRQPVSPDPGAPSAGVRTISIVDIFTPPATSTCHVIEVLVALGYQGLSKQDSHTFDGRGGDSITWLYNPSGDPSGCPIYDAGPVDGAFLETGPDALIIPDGGTE
jgi:hypothetical protein